MATTVADDAASAGASDKPVDIDPFRRRLLDGLAASITERGYRASTVADIVRHARTSKRTFYDQFPSKEQCFLELLHADVGKLAEDIRDAVDPDADWQAQIRQAVQAYVGHIESRPALTLSWIRELPSLDAAARPFQRRGMQLLTSLLVNLSGSPGFQKVGLPPLTRPKAVILVGGLRELTALAVEDGRSVREIVEPAVDASVALVAYRRWQLC
ncbi:TetR/AcrR family transcriptional regulator [Mycobacterium sp.]|uniref:TetR/AcrR family transcriptional regulator n=1 Tax=Mycobacterium sp. TaxID=1785 RepID=UPI003F95539C